MKFCVYLTIYLGNKLPMFYIGSSSCERVLVNKYNGTVTSKRYSKIWNYEQRHNSHLFKTLIIQRCETRELALDREEYIQRKLNVVRNPLYINMTYANKGFLNCGPHSEETIKKISKAKTGKRGAKHSEETKRKMSQSSLGKPKSLSHRENMTKSRIGKKLTEEQKLRFKGCHDGFRHTEESKAKMSFIQRNLPQEKKDARNRSARERHKNTVVTLKNPNGELVFGNSLEDMCNEYGLHTTSMLRSLKSGKPLGKRSAKSCGWQLLSIDKGK